MNELIAIKKKTIGEEEVSAVNARELHVFLEVKTHYSTWIAKQIKRYGFVVNSDFYVLETATGAGGDDRKDYIISIDMAKELSMVERNSKGKEARRYFIKMEKIAKGDIKAMTPAELALSSAKSIVEMEKRQLKLEQSQRKTEVAILETKQKIDALESKICSDPGYFTITGYANLLNVKVPTKEANQMGRRASVLSKSKGYKIGKVPHERWGNVNSYHDEILETIFSE